MTPKRAYKITSPQGKKFSAMIVDDDWKVMTTREGRGWALDPLFHYADLIMPEQEFLEWDIIEVPLRSVRMPANKKAGPRDPAVRTATL